MKSRLLAVTLVCCLLLALAGAAYAGFSDLNGHWAQKQVQAWADRGLVNGYPDGTFQPDKAVTRAEFVALVNRAMNKQNPEATADFKDVQTGDWFYREVAAAVKAGYVSGYEDKTFRPNQAITRQEAASIIDRLLQLDRGDEGALTKFKDAAQMGSWARGSLAAVVAKGLMGGYPDGTFGPTRSITRAEAVVVLDRATGGQETPPAGTVKVTGVKLDRNTLSLTVGSTVQLEATVSPDNATDKNVTWSTSDESIATVDDQGNVKGVAVGKATITVTTADGGFQDTCEVTVERRSGGGGGGGGGGGSTTVPVTGVSLDKTSLTMTVGDTAQLTAAVTPDNASNKSVTWSSDNTAVATVDAGGKVTAVAPGTATITVKTADGGKTASCVVTVQPASKWPVEVEKVQLSVLAGNTAVKVFIKSEYVSSVAAVTVNGQAMTKQTANPAEWRAVLAGTLTEDDLTVEVNKAATPTYPPEVDKVQLSVLANNTAVKVFIKADKVDQVESVSVNNQPATQQTANPAEWRVVLPGSLTEADLQVIVTLKQAPPPPVEPGQLIDMTKSNISYSKTFGTNAYIYILPGKDVTSVKVAGVDASYVSSKNMWAATIDAKAGDVIEVVASGPAGSETKQFTVVDIGV
ncbi:hypothetical protein GFC01_13520 [Desulfofundulus thermobenzoicus]|uniref:SLH domain-containing protein n=1 Tax=Desulfofundulus thermobenzoicus TaxID=29376 RepID=A0A6N7IVT9_9FIRM|nr:S-layer homology domain-containing protein [Desulfofundulus thermobenzoicus]MQL53258.1 hypothetical protein [Desulfofundulus thermobenzoicus]